MGVKSNNNAQGWPCFTLPSPSHLIRVQAFKFCHWEENVVTEILLNIKDMLQQQLNTGKYYWINPLCDYLCLQIYSLFNETWLMIPFENEKVPFIIKMINLPHWFLAIHLRHSSSEPSPTELKNNWLGLDGTQAFPCIIHSVVCVRTEEYNRYFLF